MIVYFYLFADLSVYLFIYFFYSFRWVFVLVFIILSHLLHFILSVYHTASGENYLNTLHTRIRGPFRMHTIFTVIHSVFFSPNFYFIFVHYFLFTNLMVQRLFFFAEKGRQ